MNQPPTARAGLSSSIISQSLVSASKPKSERVAVQLIFLRLDFYFFKNVVSIYFALCSKQGTKVQRIFLQRSITRLFLNFNLYNENIDQHRYAPTRDVSSTHFHNMFLSVVVFSLT